MFILHWCPTPPPGETPPPSPTASPVGSDVESEDELPAPIPPPLSPGPKLPPGVKRPLTSAPGNLSKRPRLEVSAGRQPLSPLSANAMRPMRKSKKARAKREKADKNEAFGTTLNRGYYSIRKILELLPNIDKQAMTQDLYKRKERITDEDGVRLAGTAPYDYDVKGTRTNYALTWRLLEMLSEKGHIDLVILSGSHVRAAFVDQYGDFENGDFKTIGGRQLRIFHVFHPEYIGTYAPRKQLGKLKDTLRLVKKAMPELVVRFDVLDEMIATRGQPPALGPCLRRSTKPDVRRGASDIAWIKDMAAAGNKRSAWQRAYYDDPIHGEERRQTRSRTALSYWWHPTLGEARRKAKSIERLATYADPVKGPMLRQALSESAFEQFNGPQGAVNRVKVSQGRRAQNPNPTAASILAWEEYDRLGYSRPYRAREERKALAKAQEQAGQPHLRPHTWRPTAKNQGMFDPGESLKRVKQLAPSVAILPTAELLFWLPCALHTLEVDYEPLQLPQPTQGRPYSRDSAPKKYGMSLAGMTMTTTQAFIKLLAATRPLDGIKQYVAQQQTDGTINESNRHYLQNRVRVQLRWLWMAEEIAGWAKCHSVKGMANVQLPARKTAHWEEVGEHSRNLEDVEDGAQAPEADKPYPNGLATTATTAKPKTSLPSSVVLDTVAKRRPRESALRDIITYARPGEDLDWTKITDKKERHRVQMLIGSRKSTAKGRQKDPAPCTTKQPALSPEVDTSTEFHDIDDYTEQPMFCSGVATSTDSISTDFEDIDDYIEKSTSSTELITSTDSMELVDLTGDDTPVVAIEATLLHIVPTKPPPALSAGVATVRSIDQPRSATGTAQLAANRRNEEPVIPDPAVSGIVARQPLNNHEGASIDAVRSGGLRGIGASTATNSSGSDGGSFVGAGRKLGSVVDKAKGGRQATERQVKERRTGVSGDPIVLD
ncbi:Chromatin structure remodeling complex protein sfh1 [Elasticomyces elasticus]|nr:Chromatin structure remodeling complex protein sfh1 [Elasticomyces elasticus]KAK4965564.1 Chromatin structure remodeling complex protein sfh1 [Elasticomyces elasticus]